MEFYKFFAILTFVFIFLYFWYRKKIQRMRNLMESIPEVKKLPWKEMIVHLFNNDKGSNYSKLNRVNFS